MKTELTVKFDRRRFLENLVEELQVPPSRYEAAERSYKSLGEWLHRPGSIVRDYHPDVYVQGSFRLGTAIKPVSDQEDYDIDMVCCLEYEKSELTQAELKRQVGYEIKAYANRFHMSAPQEGRRCWTLDYADGAQFHMDILPSVPDTKKRRALRIAEQNLERIGATALAITDKKHPHYQFYSEDWPCSNPKGYALWFRDRMGSVFTQRAQRLVEQQMQVMSIEDVPNYRIRTPLQSSIQLLKRHRDVMFSKCSDEKPISILITTLAAHAYDGEEENLANTLSSILQKMNYFIENRQGVDWVKNPADPEENFADKWAEHPERRDSFFKWLNQARKDFHAAMDAPTANFAGNCLAKHLGESLVSRTLAKELTYGSAEPIQNPQPPKSPSRLGGTEKAMTTASVRTYTRADTSAYVSDKLCNLLKVLVTRYGLDPTGVVDAWDRSVDHAARTWLKLGHLQAIIIEFYRPWSSSALARWDFPIRYDGAAVNEMWTNHLPFEEPFPKVRMPPIGCSYRIILIHDHDAPPIDGLPSMNCLFLGELVAHEAGTVIVTSDIIASARYYC